MLWVHKNQLPNRKCRVCPRFERCEDPYKNREAKMSLYSIRVLLLGANFRLKEVLIDQKYETSEDTKA